MKKKNLTVFSDLNCVLDIVITMGDHMIGCWYTTEIAETTKMEELGISVFPMHYLYLSCLSKSDKKKKFYFSIIYNKNNTIF